MGYSTGASTRPAWRLPKALAQGGGKAQQIQDLLSRIVERSEPGTLLPSERELVEQYAVARMTVIRAIEALEAKGLVYRIPRKGTFVAERKVSASPELTSFSEEMASLGKKASSIQLASDVVEAGTEIGRRLEISPRARIVRIERVRHADDEPIAVERVHLPAARFPGLADEDLGSASLYRVLADRYGCRVGSAEQLASAVPLSPAEAHLLHAEVGLPSFRIERVTRDDDGAIVSFGRSIFRGDRYDLRMRLESRSTRRDG
jgi:GntR family transcriptional regulator